MEANSPAAPVPARPSLVAQAAAQSGAVAACWRPSAHAFSGAVVAVVFPSAAAACAFARQWAASVQVFCCVRRLARPGFWSVSVPAPALPAGVARFAARRPVSARVAAFSAGLSALGF